MVMLVDTPQALILQAFVQHQSLPAANLGMKIRLLQLGPKPTSSLECHSQARIFIARFHQVRQKMEAKLRGWVQSRLEG